MRPAPGKPAQPLPPWLRRAILVAVFPVAVVVAAVDRIWGEIKTLPFYLKCDLRDNRSEAKRMWRE